MLKKPDVRIVVAFEKAVESKECLSWLNRANFLLRMGMKGTERYITAEDIVYEVITKTIEGQRQWDIDKIPLSVYMQEAIWSEFSNHLKKESRNTIVDFKSSQRKSSVREAINRYSTGRDEIEDEYDWNDFVSKCYEIAGDDYESRVFLDFILEDRRCRDIAEFLGTDEDHVQTIKKRLARKLKRKFKVV
jgi:DNA-directed RNA polymerase specialized sigma24 family protein